MGSGKSLPCKDCENRMFNWTTPQVADLQFLFQFDLRVPTNLWHTFPQSLFDVPVADAILAFFLLSFNFSPARTTSDESFLQSGQNLKIEIYQSCQSCQELLQAKVSGPSLCETKLYNYIKTSQFKTYTLDVLVLSTIYLLVISRSWFYVCTCWL